MRFNPPYPKEEFPMAVLANGASASAAAGRAHDMVGRAALLDGTRAANETIHGVSFR